MRLFHKAVGPEGPVDPHSIPAVPDVSTAAPEAAAGATPAELTAENVLLSAVVDSSKALTSCAELLAKAVGGIAQTSSMLEGVREDPAVLPGPTSRVNYFNSVAKASQASQAAHIKNLQWDWISHRGIKSTQGYSQKYPSLDGKGHEGPLYNMSVSAAETNKGVGKVVEALAERPLCKERGD